MVRKPLRQPDRRPGRRPSPALPPTAPLAAALAALAALAGGTPAAAQTVDSAELVEQLRDRQRDFERFRRRRFPPTHASAASRCDERVGRYCLVHDEGEGWEPGPEDPEVGRRRAQLVERLDRAARILPGDGWIAGQRVRYLVASERPEAAVKAARSCRAAAWWCSALEAFAHHHRRAPGPADSAFDVALARMPDSTRRRWLDPTVFLEDEAAESLDGRRGDERRAWLARLWWLTDPLWSVPGRGRRTAHLVRRVRSRLQRDAAGPYGAWWNGALEELTLRYGWPVGWERVRTRRYRPGVGTPVVAHYASWARPMVPPLEVLEDPARAGPESWPLEPEAPKSEYGPPHLDTLARPSVRWARFPRPDSLHLVAAWRWEEGTGGEASLRLRTGPGDRGVRARGPQRGPTGRLRATTVPGPAVASLELRAGDRARAARHRTGIRPPARPEGVPGVSDLLLTTVPEPGSGALPREDSTDLFRRSVGADLAAAAHRARPPGPARPGGQVGLYWETYGPARTLRGGTTAVRLVGADGGFFDDLARGLGLAGDRRDVSVSWPTAPSAEGRVHPSAVILTLPPGLEAGSYRLEVTVRPPGREPVVARLRLRVEEAPDGAGE